MSAGSRLQRRLAEWHHALHQALSAPEETKDLLTPHWQALEVQAERLAQFVASAPRPEENWRGAEGEGEGDLWTVVRAEPPVQLAVREALVQIEGALIK